MTRWAEFLNSIVRPLAALSIIESLCFAFIAQTMGRSDLDVKDAFLSIGSGVIGWWFGKREAEKETQAAVTAAVQAATQQPGGRP